MTDAAGLVEHHRAEVDQIEQMMLADPGLIPMLRPTPEQLWAFWCDCRILGRRRMSARTKSRAIRWFGPLYAKLPW